MSAVVAVAVALLAAAPPPARAELPPAPAWRVLDKPQTIRVNPQREGVSPSPDGTVVRIADAARIARDGDTVLIAPGDYVGDVATWPQSRLTIRAERCCARIVADGAHAEGKGIWVIKGDDVVVEGIVFEGARVPSGNGAGIRHEGGRLTIRDSRFTRNQMGILTWNDPRGEVVIERSEFDGNEGTPDEIGHQIYVGRISRFVLRESYVHDGAVGHLVKSRARENDILYNRLADGAGGHASYELEFAEGGVARVVGNVIAQSRRTENPVIVSYGAEGYRHERNELWLVHNTFVDEAADNSVGLRVFPGPGVVRASGNLWFRRGAPAPIPASGADAVAGVRDLPGVESGDFRLSRRSPLAAKSVPPMLEDGAPAFDREYVHPLSSRALEPGPRVAGAVQALAP